MHSKIKSIRTYIINYYILIINFLHSKQIFCFDRNAYFIWMWQYQTGKFAFLYRFTVTPGCPIERYAIFKRSFSVLRSIPHIHQICRLKFQIADYMWKHRWFIWKWWLEKVQAINIAEKISPSQVIQYFLGRGKTLIGNNISFKIFRTKRLKRILDPRIHQSTKVA